MMLKREVPSRNLERTGDGWTAMMSTPCGPASTASDVAKRVFKAPGCCGGAVPRDEEAAAAEAAAAQKERQDEEAADAAAQSRVARRRADAQLVPGSEGSSKEVAVDALEA